METKKRKSFLVGIPSWALALLTLFLAFFVLMVVSDILAFIFKISDDSVAAGWVFYGLYNLIIAVGCYYICQQNPKSIVYVPLLCNALGIFSAIAEPTFWNSSLWIVICSGWLLSIITSLIGAQSGRKKAISGNQNT